MRKNLHALSFLLILTLPCLARQEPVAFVGVKYLKAAETREMQARDCVLELVRETGAVRLSFQGGELLSLSKAQITHLVYERMTKQRVGTSALIVWPLPFTKGRKHFLTIQFKTPEGKRDFASLSLAGEDVRDILDALESATGVKIQRYNHETR
jgi:hypothetical protein